MDVQPVACPTCGHLFAANHDAEFPCCGQKVLIAAPGNHSLPKPLPTGDGLMRVKKHADLVLKACNHQCEHWGSKGGSVGCLLSPTKPCDIRYYNRKGFACFNKAKRFPASWGLEKQRVLISDGCRVISGTDRKFIRGAYFLIWTLLRTNNVGVTLYVHDCSGDEPHIEQMAKWGVDIKPMPSTISSDVPFHATWRKPACILDALQDSEKVLWLDADTSVGGDLQAAFDVLDHSTFAANHGEYRPSNKNGDALHRLLGPPRRRWIGEEHPCAGVVGFARRHRWLVKEWSARCQFITRDDNRWLWNPDMYATKMSSQLKYHDQGVLQDLLIDDTQCGRVWSNFRVKRTGTIPELMHQTFGYNHKVCHYGGRTKPFFDWPDELYWGDPRDRD